MRWYIGRIWNYDLALVYKIKMLQQISRYYCALYFRKFVDLPIYFCIFCCFLGNVKEYHLNVIDILELS